jgi:hypothetical protein
MLDLNNNNDYNNSNRIPVFCSIDMKGLQTVPDYIYTANRRKVVFRPETPETDSKDSSADVAERHKQH